MSNTNEDVVDPAEKFDQEELPMIDEKALKRSPTEYGYTEINDENSLPHLITEGDVIVRVNQNGHIAYQLVLETYQEEMIVYILDRKQYAVYSNDFLIDDTVNDEYEITIFEDPWGLREQTDQE